MKKVTLSLILVVALAFFNTEAFAQLSERVNNPSTFRLGTRPTQGNLGFSVGYSMADNDSLKNGNAAISSYIPLISLKYYLADDIVISLGMKSMKSSRKISGDLDQTLNGGTASHYEKNNITTKNYLKIGVEKHFLASNILDPYIGVGIPLGYWKESNGSTTTYTDGSGQGSVKSRLSFYYGFELKAGIQAFIADLPIALGVEGGLTGYGLKGDKYKVEGTNAAGDSYKYYTTDDTGGMAFSSLSSSSYAAGGFIRVTLAYYFR